MDDEKPMQPQPDYKSLLKIYQENSDTIEKVIREQARLMRILYQALVTEGFTEYQALEIVKAKGAMA